MKDVFADLRATYFTLNRASHFPIPSNATEPWGVIMEIAYPQATVTTVTFADGTVSVLRSSGGGFFGVGDEPVQSAGKAFLKQAQLIQPQATLTNDFPAPNVACYFLPSNGWRHLHYFCHRKRHETAESSAISVLLHGIADTSRVSKTSEASAEMN